MMTPGALFAHHDDGGGGGHGHALKEPLKCGHMKHTDVQKCFEWPGKYCFVQCAKVTKYDANEPKINLTLQYYFLCT